MSKLTQKSKGSTCIRCGADGAYSCHFNGYRSHSYGKGRGRRCSDIATAELCHTCDQEFSESNYHKFEGGSKSIDRSEQFLHLCMLTNIRRFETGVLKT